MLGRGAQSFVELFAIGRNQRFLQKLIDSDLLLAPEAEGVLADVPAMQVEGLAAARELGYADGVQAAGDGLSQALALDRAQAVPVAGEVAERAGPTVCERGHEIAVPVDGKKAVANDRRPTLFGHQLFEGPVIAFEGRDLFLFKRRAALSFDAARSLAFLVIAGEVLTDDLLRHEDVAYLHYCSEKVAMHYLAKSFQISYPLYLT